MIINTPDDVMAAVLQEMHRTLDARGDAALPKAPITYKVAA